MRLLGLSLLLFLCNCSSQPPHQLTLYAAASLTGVAHDFQVQSPIPFVIRAEGSGRLSHEISRGAPADVFLSADPLWLDYLEERGLILPGSRRVVAGNRLVIAVASSVPPLQSLGELMSLDSIAMGEWTSVPAGRYAKEALEAAGLWKDIQGQCVFTRNVRSALTHLEQKQTQGAIVYASDVSRSSKNWFSVPEELHRPIRIEGCVIKSTPQPERALQLLETLHSPQAAQLFDSWGFQAPL